MGNTKGEGEEEGVAAGHGDGGVADPPYLSRRQADLVGDGPR